MPRIRKMLDSINKKDRFSSPVLSLPQIGAKKTRQVVENHSLR